MGCEDNDSTSIDPSAVADVNPPGWGGSGNILDNRAGAGGLGGEGGEGGTPAVCSIAFVTPDPSSVPQTFGPADDRDGTPCGSAFTTDVVVSSSGASVTLFADGTPWATQTVTDETSSFAGVVLGSRTPATSSLRAVATMTDGSTCEATLDSLGVDCDGPTCVLVGPTTSAWLVSTDDSDTNTVGLQANFRLQTDAEAGQPAHLILNGAENAMLSSTVATQTAEALFSNVTLSEGPARSVQGECRDAAGNVTRSAVGTWSVTLATCEVAFVTPVPGSDPLILGASADTDGDACGTDFTTSVEVTTNAESLVLLVDEQPVQTLVVSGASAQFTGVPLSTRTPVTSTLKVQATMPDGRVCYATRESVVVDCEGPSCTLIGPSNNLFLNIDNDDVPVTSGLQADFLVNTNAENVDQIARLVVDGNFAAPETGIFADDAGTMRATFPQITLDEGPVRTVQAECEDELGNVTRSALLTWAVDLTGCSIQIDSVADGNDPVTRTHDEDLGIDDIQVPVDGQVAGDLCTAVRVGVCSQPLGDFSEDALVGSDWTLPLTLTDVSASGEVCAQVRDDAGNVTEARVPVTVRSDDPVVEIASPTSNSHINLLGTSDPDAIADLVPGSGTCEATFVVNCTDLGANVALLIDAVALPDQVECLEVPDLDPPLDPPYLGQATFSSISLSTLSDPTEDHVITAQQTVAGLVGSSAAVLIGADCEAPVLAFTNPLCGGQLHLVDDDQQADPGLQHDVDVTNSVIDVVDLTVTRLGAQGGPDLLSATAGATTTSFPIVNFGDPGDVTLAATATDGSGNVGTAECQVRVVVEPVVNILVPTAAQVLSTADDCVPLGGGFGITVSGTTGAAVGSTVEVAVGADPAVAIDPVAAGAGLNTFSGCVAISDGINSLLTVTVTETPNPPGRDTVTLTVDTAVPTDPVGAPVVSNIDARAGTADFTWAHVGDAGNGVLAAYEMHCAATQIVDEPGWTAAREVLLTQAPVALTPPPADAVETDLDGSFRVGTTEFCVIRGRDVAGALTPLSGAAGNATVTLAFVQTDFTSVVNSTTQVAFTNVAALGDINADGANDMIYGAINQGLQIFFGGPTSSPGADGGTISTPFDTTADITLINGTPSVSAFGAVMAGLGDVTGDGIADFAVSARALGGNAGTVYVFFGKSNWPTTPTTINVTTGGCGADLCLVGSAAGAFFGWDITGARFANSVFNNGSVDVPVNDIVIGARAANASAGVVYVIRGGTQLTTAAARIINVPSGNPDGFVINPPASRSLFGHAVAAVGNGADNLGDLAIGALGVSSGNVGALFFLNGEAYTSAAGTGLIAPSAAPMIDVVQGSGADFASPVRAIGDHDGDGLQDLALGRNFSAGGGLGTGEVYLRNANVPTFSAGPGFLLSFPAAGADNDYASFIATGFHPGLGTVGDLDGDGATELVLGSNVSNGSVALFYGSTPAERGVDSLDVPVPPTGHTRASANFTFPGSLSTSLMVPNFVGDFDGDGFPDLAIVDGGSGTDKLILLH